MEDRGRGTEPPETSAKDEPEPEETRFDWLTRRVQVMLAIVGTLVAIATGMFALAGQIAPRRSAVAEASLPQYHQSVSAVCATINDHDRDRGTDDAALRRRVAKTRSPLAARDAILESVQKVQRAGEHDLAMLVGLDAPGKLRPTVVATARAWQRTLTRLGKYAHRLDVATDDRDVGAAVDYIARLRTRMQRDITTERAGLIRLGGGQCQLDPLVVSRAVRLVEHHRSSPGAQATDPAVMSAGADASPGASSSTDDDGVAPALPSPDVAPLRDNDMAMPSASSGDALSGAGAG